MKIGLEHKYFIDYILSNADSKMAKVLNEFLSMDDARQSIAFKELLDLSQAPSNMYAQIFLGYCYVFGIFLSQNLLTAKELLESPVQSNNPAANYARASLSREFNEKGGGCFGKIPWEHISTAIEYYKASAQQNFAPALAVYAEYQLQGYSVETGHPRLGGIRKEWLIERDHIGALKNLDKACTQGYYFAYYILGNIYREGVKHYESYGWEAGDYHEKVVIERDLQKAIEFYKRAANLGFKEAKLALASLLEKHDTSRSAKEEVRYWRTSAMNEDAHYIKASDYKKKLSTEDKENMKKSEIKAHSVEKITESSLSSILSYFCTCRCRSKVRKEETHVSSRIKKK